MARSFALKKPVPEYETVKGNSIDLFILRDRPKALPLPQQATIVQLRDRMPAPRPIRSKVAAVAGP